MSSPLTRAADAPPACEAPSFRDGLEALLRWRRDVRSFRSDPIAPELMAHLFELAALAPSVGLSQPWRFVQVRSPEVRAAVRTNFERCNADALATYEGEVATAYARLKLSGLDNAPEQVAVFCDRAVETGRGLGRRTMPETLDYSVVAAIQTLWLAARTYGLGVGWVSILDAAEVAVALDAPAGWRLIAYLCLGLPQEADDTPELERRGWETRAPTSGFVSVV